MYMQKMKTLQLHNVHSFQRRSGFTLLEALLYVATSSLLLFAIASLAISMVDVRLKHSTIAEVEQQGVQVREVIAYAIRNSVSVTNPLPAASDVTLEFTTIQADDNPAIFSVIDGTLQLANGDPATTRDLTSDSVTVSNFSVTNTGSVDLPIISVSYTLSRSGNSSRNPYQYSQDFSFTVSANPNIL